MASHAVVSAKRFFGCLRTAELRAGAGLFLQSPTAAARQLLGVAKACTTLARWMAVELGLAKFGTSIGGQNPVIRSSHPEPVTSAGPLGAGP